jgi:GT2 family glycosyltransferase
VSASRTPRVGVVLLTMGQRPADLARAIESVKSQRGVEVDIAVVGNGWQPRGLPRGVSPVGLPENVGIPAGRNAGVPHVAGDYLLFLDDDARLLGDDFLVRAVRLLTERRDIGLIQPRVDGADGRPAPRRWIPRIRKGDAHRSSTCMLVWEGALVMPRPVFDATGGWGDPYFYAHEGIELAWRVWNTGHRAWYAGGLAVEHPVMSPTRHTDYYRLNARNRVWLAKRNLGVIQGVVYVAAWTAIQHLRWLRNPQGLRAWWGGFGEGVRTSPGGRQRLRVKTTWRMWLAGRAPFV